MGPLRQRFHELVAPHRSHSKWRSPSRERRGPDAVSPAPQASPTPTTPTALAEAPFPELLATTRTTPRDQAVGSASQLSRSHTILLPASEVLSDSEPAVPDQALSTSTSLLESQSIESDELEPNQKTPPSISETQARDEPCDTNGSGGGQALSDYGKDTLNPSSNQPKDRPKSLWDLAYQKLGTESEDLITAFRKVLSMELKQTKYHSNTSDRIPLSHSNADLEDVEINMSMDSEQLMAIIARGQERMKEKEVKCQIAGFNFILNEQVAQFSKLVQWGKTLVDQAVKASPEASTAWCAISLILPLLTRSAETAQVHRDGFYHVTARMKFYVTLEILLFSKDRDQSEAIPQDSIVNLYKHILEFLFRSVLRFFRGRLKNLGRDLINHEDWTAMLENIQKLEGMLSRDLDTISSASIRNDLRSLDDSTKQSLLYTEELLSVIKEERNILQKTLELKQDEKYKLPIVADAMYASADVRQDPECYSGTRRAVRARLIEWVNEKHDNIISLTGHAGTGKSTIARTLAKQFEISGELAASYFFKRGDKARNSTRLVIPTISTQLMVSIPGFKTQLWESMQTNEIAVEKLDSEVQFKMLLWNPLEILGKDGSGAANIGNKMVIIFDALDECNKQKDMFRILELFSSLKRLGRLRLSVICTGRLTPTIDESFETLKESLEKQKVLYHNLSLLDPEFSEETIADVGLYLKDTFAAIKKGNRHFKSLIWPSNKDMGMVISLCTKPKPLFVYASTLCRYVNESGKTPVRRLADWLKRSDDNAEQLDEKLDEIYRIVLDEVWSSTENGGPGLTNEEKEVLVDMLRSVVVLASLLPSEHLASLLGLFPSDAILLENFSPVLNIPFGYTAPVEIVHKSFSDFLMRQNAVGTLGFRMDIAETHAMLASKCISRMQREASGLKRDTCNLQDFGKGADEIEEAIITKGIPIDLKYACLFWVYHLQKCREHAIDQEKDKSLLKILPDLLQDIQSFLEKHFLHWLEALSLLRCMSDGVLAMGNLLSLLNEASSASQVTDLVEDAYRFIMANRGAIEQAPLQAYASALVFSPAGSLIRQLFQTEEPNWIITRPMMEEKWGSCIQTLYVSAEKIRSVTFSHNGELVASGMRNNLVKVWDVKSGECRKTFECQSECTESVAFSPDDKVVVSASDDGTVQTWDVSNGACIKTLEANSGTVKSIALSEDGEQVAMGLRDSSIEIWNVRTGSCLQTLRGHKYVVHSIAFSRDGKQVVSSSINDAVKIWDIGSGECNTFEIYFMATALAISPDSKRIASADYVFDEIGSIVIWEVSSHSSLQELSGHRARITCVAFHQDNKLVSSSHDNTIKIWDVSTGVCLETLADHCLSIMSIALSQDSKQLVSASFDRTIKIWNISSSINYSRLESHSANVGSIALSRDGTLFGSGSDDGFIKIWNAQTGACLHTIGGHNNQFRSDNTSIWSLVFSQDGEQIASGSSDGTVKIWNTRNGRWLKTLEQGRSTDSNISSVVSAALSQDFEYMASGGTNKTAKIWNIKSGACLKTIELDHVVSAVALSHDSKQLAAGTYKGEFTIWDPRSGVCLKNLGSQRGMICSITFSPDGKLAASHETPNPSESTIIILDINRKVCIKIIEIGAPMNNLSFDATGSYLYTDVGIIPLDASSTSNAGSAVFQPCSCGLTVDGQWITWDNRKAIWLPTEWRPNRSIIVPGFMVIGSSSGRVLSVRFMGEKFPYKNNPL